jgi:hypothetical protein
MMIFVWKNRNGSSSQSAGVAQESTLQRRLYLNFSRNEVKALLKRAFDYKKFQRRSGICTFEDHIRLDRSAKQGADESG